MNKIYYLHFDRSKKDNLFYIANSPTLRGNTQVNSWLWTCSLSLVHYSSGHSLRCVFSSWWTELSLESWAKNKFLNFFSSATLSQQLEKFPKPICSLDIQKLFDSKVQSYTHGLPPPTRAISFLLSMRHFHVLIPVGILQWPLCKLMWTNNIVLE